MNTGYLKRKSGVDAGMPVTFWSMRIDTFKALTLWSSAPSNQTTLLSPSALVNIGKLYGLSYPECP